MLEYLLLVGIVIVTISESLRIVTGSLEFAIGNIIGMLCVLVGVIKLWRCMVNETKNLTKR